MGIPADIRLPDLQVDEAGLSSSAQVWRATFGGDDCAVQEGCIIASGERRLLRFSVGIVNAGNADVVLGTPLNDPSFELSTCHGHYHRSGMASYRLLDADGVIAAGGHKQAFCMADGVPIRPDAGPARFTCEHQGISAGWKDVYLFTVDCQWVDVTRVAPGDYLLRIEVDPDDQIAESDETNNVAFLPVRIESEGTCTPEPERCGNGVDEDCDGEPDNGCAPLSGLGTCASAHLIEGSGLFRIHLDGEPTVAAPGCGGAGPDAWFTLHVSTDEVVYLSTHGSSIDTVLSLYEGTCGGTEAACIDDDCGTRNAAHAASLPAGTWWVRVKAREAASGDAQLKVIRSGCGTARAIPPGTAQIAGSTLETGDHTATRCGQGLGPDEVWYFTTCPGTSQVSFDTCDASFDSVLELRASSCRSPALAQHCNDDAIPACGPDGHGSRLAADLSSDGAGDGLWFLVVDGFRPDAGGGYTLNVNRGVR